MADPRRLKNKGQDASPPAQVYALPPRDLLYFMTDHPTDPYQFNLHVFETGMSDDAITNYARSLSATTFSGRTQLIQELAPAIYVRYNRAPSATAKGVESYLRWWWRFLDDINDILPVESVADFNELHYAYYRHLGDKLPHPGIASTFFGLLDHARELCNASRPANDKLHRLEWTALQKPGSERAVVEFAHVKRLYEHLKHLCFPAVRRLEADPAVVPTAAECQALFTLFILQTGWNVSTVLNIDIEARNADGQPSCIRPNPMNPKVSILQATGEDEERAADAEESSTVHAPKPRAGGVIQRAHSSNKQTLSPGNIILLLARQTETLRNKLRDYRAQLEIQLGELRNRGESGRHVDDITMKIKAVSREIRMPWLFHTTSIGRRRKKTCAEGIGVVNFDRSLRPYIDAVNTNLSPGEQPMPEKITLRDLRDSFIAWRWMTSHSWLDAMLAAGHSDRQSLVRYLKRKQIKQRHFWQFIKVGDAMWDTARRLRLVKDSPVFTTVVAAKVAEVSEEQIQRWCAGKDQTYVGMGCLDFYHPPKHIAPYHVPGSGCRTHRCTLCEHGILLPGGEDDQAKRLAELRYERATMPEPAWQESDLPQEMLNTEKALTQYDPDTVAALLEKWEAAIASGEHRPMTMEGAYA